MIVVESWPLYVLFAALSKSVVLSRPETSCRIDIDCTDPSRDVLPAEPAQQHSKLCLNDFIVQRFCKLDHSCALSCRLESGLLFM